MSNFFIIEGISSVSAVINNTLNAYSNSRRRLTDVYFDMSKIAKYDRANYGRYRFLKENAHRCGYVFHESTTDEISVMVSGNTHGGIAAKMEFFEIDTLSADKIKDNSFYCYLDGVDDPFNVGYIVRTMYAFGVSGVILPENNKMNLFASTVIKSSAGLTERVDMHTASPELLCSAFREKEYKIVCSSLRDSVPCHDADLKYPLLLVIGGEKRGISRAILSNADLNVRIDYSVPFNGSLPSVCAASVLGYEIGLQNGNTKCFKEKLIL